MRSLTRRSLVIGSVIAATLAAPLARADFFGGDLPLLAGILGEAIAQVAQIAQVITSFMQEIQLIQTELQSLDPTSFASLTDFVRNATIDYSTLLSQVQSMGYTLSSVNAQFRSLFPNDLSRVPLSQFQGLYAQWSDEILSASEVAARAQSIVSDLQTNAAHAESILARSEHAKGIVGQLQAVVQMLSVLHAESSNLVQTLATTGRVLTDSAASGASERQLSLEKKRRHLANYTLRGAPVRPLNRLP